MADILSSTNMSLPIPVVGVAPGPDWASDINACLTLIDSHDHSPGKGIPVTPSGINISSDLSFAGNSATTLRSVRFQSQSAALALPADVGCLYEIADDLYYNDGTGTSIRITQGGAVTGATGTITGLPSGTASAAYAAGTFTFNSATNTGANMSIASILLRNNSAGSQVCTLSPPAAMGSSYALVLPSLPGATNIMSLDVSGNIAAAINVDNSTLQLSSNTLAVKDAGITRPKLAALGQQISSSSGSFTSNSGTFTAVTNLSVTITNSGRPIWVGIMGAGGTGVDSFISPQGSGLTNATQMTLRILRDAVVVSESILAIYSTGASDLTLIVPPSSIWLIDAVTAGTYVYSVEVRADAGIFQIAISNCKLVAYEIG